MLCQQPGIVKFSETGFRKKCAVKGKNKSPRVGENPVHGLGKVLAPWAGLEPAT
jgi:hypothetical protein